MLCVVVEENVKVVVKFCLTEALIRDKLVVFDSEKCIDCGACVNACTHDAVKIEE